MPPNPGTRSNGRRVPAVSKVAFQAPLIDEATKPAKVVKAEKEAPTPPPPAAQKVELPHGRTEHNGVTILREELVSSLPSGAPFRISKLHLENDTMAYACRDCAFTGDTRGDVMAHRNRDHGARYGKKRPKVTFEPDPEQLDLVLPPRAGGVPAPSNPMEMTLGEYLSLAPTFAALGDLIDQLEHERDTLLKELREREAHDRENKHKIQVYPTLQGEVVDLRLKLRGVGSFDEMKEELFELRRWKKDIQKKLASLGFTLAEEDK